MIPSKGTYTLAAYRDADRFALVVYNTLLADVETSHYQPGLNIMCLWRLK
jgi:hypothetical protein